MKIEGLVRTRNAKRGCCTRTGPIGAAENLDEIVLDIEEPDELPDSGKEPDSHSNLGDLWSGFVDVDLHVGGILLEEERENKAAQACATTRVSNQRGVRKEGEGSCLLT